jgi:Beta-ketoacyl synthase, N-terminal domain
MTCVFIDGIGVFGTGFENWSQTRSVLRGEAVYEATSLPLPSPEWLPAAERRRTSDIIRLALCAGREALEDAGETIDDTYTVFSSSGGSGEVIHQICESLATPEREVSPTRFHNSVHNAPAGYWGIATRSEWPSTSLCAHDASFAAAVFESVAQVLSTDKPVLLLAHDLRYPEPLNGIRNVMGMFSVAMLLRRAPGPATKHELTVNVAPQSISVTAMTDASLESFRMQNPAARSLPLLSAIARGQSEAVVIENTNGGRLQLVSRTFSEAPI